MVLVSGVCNGQVELIEAGKEHEIVQETRLFDENKATTFTMRKKEGLADYRYFPEPDLLPLEVEDEVIDHIQARAHLSAWLGGSSAPHTPSQAIGIPFDQLIMIIRCMRP